MRRVLSHVPPLVGRFTGERAVPLWAWRALRAFGRHEDALMPPNRERPAARLEDPILAIALEGRSLGSWSIGVESISLLRKAVLAEHPGVILEFGSGVSTVCLAHFAASLDPAPRVISIEQDAEEVGRTNELVARLPHPVDVLVVHAPLGEESFMSSYQLDQLLLERELGDRRIGLVFIDGPAAESGARFATLPLVAPYLERGALVLLDDALRDGELRAAREWARLGHVRLDGVVAVDHGVLRARA